MATGILGQSSLSANTLTTVYTVPTSKTATMNVSITNSGASSAYIRIAIASSDTPSASEYIEYDLLLNAKNSLERSGIVANAGEKVVVYSNVANVSVSVYGYEE